MSGYPFNYFYISLPTAAAPQIIYPEARSPSEPELRDNDPLLRNAEGVWVKMCSQATEELEERS